MQLNSFFKMATFFTLRQIVLFAFLLILLPLLWLSYQAYSGFNQLSQKSNEINRNTAIYARRIEVMANVAIELERSARQYCILNDETFKTLHYDQKKQFAQMLEAHKPVLADKYFYLSISEILKQLTALSCVDGQPAPAYKDLIESLSHLQSQLAQATREAIFSKGQELQTLIADKGRSVGEQALLLCFLSFMLVILFTQMILSPVNTIRNMINVIAEGRKLDVTTFHGPKELKILAQRIIWLNERLNWLESQRHEFLRHVSHELKTPLASIREGTELLADEISGSLTTEQREVVSILDKSGRELQSLIEQLLEYNRLALIDDIQNQKIELNQLIANAISSHELVINQKKLSIKLSLAIHLCYSDEVLIKRVFDNLFSNAVHYSDEGGKIMVTSYSNESNLCIEIANSGTPIANNERKMIFEPFYQGSSQRMGPIKGSGLGLSIAQNTIRRLNGELALIEVPYAEVCFLITLPLNNNSF